MQLNDVLARLTVDPQFRRQVLDDPAGALSGYKLTADDLAAVQAWFGRDEEPGPDVTTLLASDAVPAGPLRPRTAADLLAQMLAHPELARRIQDDPAAIAAEWRLPLTEVQRLGHLEAGYTDTDTESLASDG